MRILIVPGLGDSEPDHWQSRWLRTLPGAEKVAQRDWHSPRAEDWVRQLDVAVMSRPDPVVLIAHSLACSAVVAWAGRSGGGAGRVRGAMLVAPADVDAPTLPAGPTGFGPMPLAALPFPALVVSGRDDDFVSIERAQFFAKCWGARFVDAGPAGHLNLAAGFGPWPAGEALLDEFRKSLQQ